jgi:hypothetical protein
VSGPSLRGPRLQGAKFSETALRWCCCQRASVCCLHAAQFIPLRGGFIAAPDPPHWVKRLVIVGAPGLGLSAGLPLTLRSLRHLPGTSEQREVHRYKLAAIMHSGPAASYDHSTSRRAVGRVIVGRCGALRAPRH